MTDNNARSLETANGETSDASVGDVEGYTSVKHGQKPDSSISPSSKRFTRLACNRCHSHKLRCVRSDMFSNSEGCERCFRANTKCVYGTPMRLGRPPCTSNANQTGNNKNNGDGDVGDSSSSNSGSTYSTNGVIPGNQQTLSSGDIVLHQHQDLVVHGNVSQSPEPPAKTKSKTKKRKVGDSFTVPTTDSPTLSWSIADNDVMMPLDGEVLGPSSTVLHSGGDHASTIPHANYDNSRDLSIFTTFEPLQWNLPHLSTLPGAADYHVNGNQPFSDLFPESFGIHWPSHEDLSGDNHTFPSLSDQLSSFESSPTDPYGDATATMNDCIQDLAELQSMLYRCSVSSPATAVGLQGRVGDGLATMKLDNISTNPLASTECQPQAISDTQADSIFTTAQAFINILNRLATHAPGANAAKSPNISRNSVSPTNAAGISGQSVQSNQTPSSGSASGGQYNATFFLVLTCYLRLLNICDPFVSDLRLRLQNSNITAQPTAAGDLPSLRLGQFTPPASSELQILLLVHAIRHLLDRIDKGIMTCFPLEMEAGAALTQESANCATGDPKRRIHVVAMQFTLKEIQMREDILHRGVAGVTDMLKDSALL
ncbi:hypothetical protein ONS95_001312 [Cadophora gregata]|uniref:uncharacterized protein n=1 Tax=Cadophora gregata TaxID=51156 RepID=UPI0026DC4ADE|nr:uncharacterized protein ONS95_001312 [Cadophora gregata]KAK0101876.1 hypothetical protein ONS96_005851 [Cadophora gregata f. sp. sojae]KAK0129386.1 hypothetical protein ONS95_001312 [Cadophora gregata]